MQFEAGFFSSSFPRCVERESIICKSLIKLPEPWIPAFEGMTAKDKDIGFFAVKDISTHPESGMTAEAASKTKTWFPDQVREDGGGRIWTPYTIKSCLHHYRHSRGVLSGNPLSYCVGKTKKWIPDQVRDDDPDER